MLIRTLGYKEYVRSFTRWSTCGTERDLPLATQNMGLLSWLSWSPRGGENGSGNTSARRKTVIDSKRTKNSVDVEESVTTSSSEHTRASQATGARAELSSKKSRVLRKSIRADSIKRKGQKKRNGTSLSRKKQEHDGKIFSRKSESSSDGATAGKVHFKRVKSLWKVRPLPVDEKIKIFIENRDDGCAKYDGGDFYEWLQECKAGRADPMEAGAYPLVIQDSDLRHLLEIKNPSSKALETIRKHYKNEKTSVSAPTKKKDSKAEVFGIQVPTWRRLHRKDWPEAILCHQQIPRLVRNPGGDAVKLKKSPQMKGNQRDGEVEHAYLRYMQPTPDDLDQAIEYDLDEEDEKWLEKYNKKGIQLNEEWMEHLMDRMEKEYTSELQKHPEKWILKKQQGHDNGQGYTKGGKGSVKGLMGTLPPPLILPPISEIFPLGKCLEARGLNLDGTIVRDVYNYWKRKHQKSGRPLIQRLWYEPPWHRKATDTTAKTAENEDVFAGYDVPSTLSRIRKRKMNDAEVQLRFDCMRRDLEMVRTIADLVRRREKLKKQETMLLQSEWASRMKDIANGHIVSTTRGQVKSLPPKLASLAESTRNAPRQSYRAAKEEQKCSVERTISEDRAARLAARRNVRAEALASRSVKRPKKLMTKKSTARTRTSTTKGTKSSSNQPRSRTGQFLSFNAKRTK